MAVGTLKAIFASKVWFGSMRTTSGASVNGTLKSSAFSFTTSVRSVTTPDLLLNRTGSGTLKSSTSSLSFCTCCTETFASLVRSSQL